MKLEIGSFVNVVASVDLTSGAGEILYVQPTSKTLASQGKRHEDFELVVLDASGHELSRVRPVVRLPASLPKGGAVPPGTTGLIQEDIELAPGMATVLLLHRGVERARFDGGEGAPVALSTRLGPALAASASRRVLVVDAAPAEGVSYTVQVKPADSSHWHTIAVSQKTPRVELDRNQFPGVSSALVRVLRSTGFEQHVVSEEDVCFEYET